MKKAKNRLGEKSEKINWIVSDINDFVSNNKYDLWHDRAAFHFLKDSSQINNYVELANLSLNSKGKIILGTFSSNGPLKCSGLEISRYNSSSINEIFKKHFILLNHRISIHPTPFDTFQEFLFTVFEKK